MNRFYFVCLQGSIMCPRRIEFHKWTSSLSIQLAHMFSIKGSTQKASDMFFSYSRKSRGGLANGVNDMQNLWDSTSFPDANYRVICHIMPQTHKKSGASKFHVSPAFSTRSQCSRLWCRILIFKLDKKAVKLSPGGIKSQREFQIMK